MSLTALSGGRRPRPEVLAFLDGIKDRPEDDAPRLLLADWLEAQGDPLGEFLRSQVVHARMGLRDSRRGPLECRELELLRGHGDEWLGPLRTLAVPCTFERGLVRIAVHAPTHLAALGPESAST